MKKTVPGHVALHSQKKGVLVRLTCVCRAVSNTALKQHMKIKIIIIMTVY